jgi:hypothetical protein
MSTMNLSSPSVGSVLTPRTVIRGYLGNSRTDLEDSQKINMKVSDNMYSTKWFGYIVGIARNDENYRTVRRTLVNKLHK